MMVVEKRPVTLVNWRRVVLIAAVLLAATAAYYPYSPAGVQARNMRTAAAHAERLRPDLSADSRFRDVTLGAYTGGLGSLIVLGRVDSEQDLAALRQILDASSPPVEVAWAVKVYADPVVVPATTRQASD